MIETQVRALFTSIADGEPAPSRVDTGLAHRRGKTRLRWRRAGLAGAPVLAAAVAVAVVLAVGTAPARPGPGPVAGGPGAAPHRFNPLAPYAAFGWLPRGESLAYGASSRALVYLVAGSSAAKTPWLLQVYPNGHCRLTGRARGITCATPGAEVVLRLGGRAPAVHGHPAYWGHTGSARVGAGQLAWQYSRAGWAVLSWQDLTHPGFAWRPQAVRIANHVRFGAHAAPPLAFPAQLFGVPAAWRVSSAIFVPAGALLRASGYTVAALPAGHPIDQSQTGLPAFRFNLATPKPSCPVSLPGKAAHEVINGYRVTVGQVTAGTDVPGQVLCAPDADGLAVVVTVYGKHPLLSPVTLFAHHLLLLGPHPARWARVPIALPVRLGR